MIKESVFLFLLIGGDSGSFEEQYVGKLSSCLDSKEIVRKLEEKIVNINGYLCIDSKSFLARQKFMKTPTPDQERIIKEVQEVLVPKIKPRPLLLKKRHD